jgi:hypothetical protein
LSGERARPLMPRSMRLIPIVRGNPRSHGPPEVVVARCELRNLTRPPVSVSQISPGPALVVARDEALGRRASAPVFGGLCVNTWSLPESTAAAPSDANAAAKAAKSVTSASDAFRSLMIDLLFRVSARPSAVHAAASAHPAASDVTR